MAQILAIHTSDHYDPRVRDREAIAAALKSKLITTTRPTTTKEQ